MEPNRYENVHGTQKTYTRIKTLERSQAHILHKMRAKHELGGGGLKPYINVTLLCIQQEAYEMPIKAGPKNEHNHADLIAL